MPSLRERERESRLDGRQSITIKSNKPRGPSFASMSVGTPQMLACSSDIQSVHLNSVLAQNQARSEVASADVVARTSWLISGHSLRKDKPPWIM